MFRSGQWVKFNAIHSQLFADAHRAQDGKIVGIYRKESTDAATGMFLPAAIAVVKSNGDNVDLIVDGRVVPLMVATSQPGLAPVLDKADIPAARLANNPGWKPTP